METCKNVYYQGYKGFACPSWDRRAQCVLSCKLDVGLVHSNIYVMRHAWLQVDHSSIGHFDVGSETMLTEEPPSKAPIVGLTIEPTPSDSLFPPGPTGNQRQGILIIPTSQDGPLSCFNLFHRNGMHSKQVMSQNGYLRPNPIWHGHTQSFAWDMVNPKKWHVAFLNRHATPFI